MVDWTLKLSLSHSLYIWLLKNNLPFFVIFFIVDIDECSTNRHKCHKNAYCVNTPGEYRCKCNDGYEGDGQICKRMSQLNFVLYLFIFLGNCFFVIISNSCLQTFMFEWWPMCSTEHVFMSKGLLWSSMWSRLVLQHKCFLLFLNFPCLSILCNHDSRILILDIDECQLGLHHCPANSKCVNKPGWYHCECNQGYEANHDLTDLIAGHELGCQGMCRIKVLMMMMMMVNYNYHTLII